MYVGLLVDCSCIIENVHPLHLVFWYSSVVGPPKKCCEQFIEVEQSSIFSLMYSMNTNNEQDLHLQRMIEVSDVKKHRARKED